MDETCSATTKVTLEQVAAQAGGTYPIDSGGAAAQGSYAQTGVDVLPIVIALAAIAVIGVAAFLIARRKRALAATVGIFAVAAACMLPLPAFADISVTVPLETQATIAADGTITIEDGQMVNTGDEAFVLSSVRLDAPSGVSGTWTLSSDGVPLYNGGANGAQDADVTVEAGEIRSLDWSTTFGGKEAGALVGSRIATATYTVTPEDAFATIYSNGTMIFTRGVPDAEQEAKWRQGSAIVGQWTDFEDTVYNFDAESIEKSTLPPWLAEAAADEAIADAYFAIENVAFLEPVKPVSTSGWFYAMEGAASMDLSLLDTSSVTDMSYMFAGCSSLTELTLPNSFDVSKVTDMGSMFCACEALTELSLPESFDTSSVTDTSFMFYGCSALTELSLPESFDTSNVTDMGSMFCACYALTELTLPNSFDVSKVTDMGSMFHNCPNLTSLDLSGWNTGKVTDMDLMFRSCSNLTSLDLSGWNTGNVTDMEGMFQGCSSLTELTLPETFDTSNVTDMSYMFNSCMLTELTLPESFDTSRVTDMFRMFFGCSSLERITYGDKFGAATELPELPSDTWYDIATGEQFTRETMNNRSGTYVNDPALLPEGVEFSSLNICSNEGMEEAGGIAGADEAAEEVKSGGAIKSGSEVADGLAGSDCASEVETAGEAADEEPSGLSEDAADTVNQVAVPDVPQISETLPIVGVDGDVLSGADDSSPAPYPSDELRFAA